MKHHTQKFQKKSLLGTAVILANIWLAQSASAQIFPPFGPTDPGVRGGAAAAGGPVSGLGTGELSFFNAGQDVFSESEGVGDGLGPRFNLDSCVGCHAQPAMGGSAPAVNPQVNLATAFGARNTVPSFITANGPVREARFKSDGGVHALFVVSGRSDSTGNASNCNITQENFATQVQNNNVSFRIPTPTFGAGLIEGINDATLAANLAANASQKSARGITGRLNHTGNDGTVTRFGWKAQNKSMIIFSGEAYNVEMGISNEVFEQERDETAACQFKHVPNDITNADATTPAETLSDAERFSLFMRFLAAPTPSTTAPGGSTSINNGKQVFASVGCSLCHTPTLQTGSAAVAALSNKPVNLLSDLAVHHMGPGLADGISQGVAGGDEFRTAPLWGLGQRIFFLHDGRTKDIVQAITAHSSAASGSTPASEANSVITSYNALPIFSKQDLVNYLRSL
ncbi:MAG TPA: di-heme oxidoredictase family protein [Spongiibacteraceae bacterium]